MINMIVKSFWIDAELTADLAYRVTGKQQAHQVLLELKFFIGTRPFIDKGTLTHFAAVTLAIATVPESVVEVFVSVDGKSKVVAIIVTTSRQPVTVNVSQAMKLVHYIAIVK
ncbi:hypothetical protein GCM10007906_31020 [Vibrio hyugaensis]|uniref:Uncharacterized protein n=1 Tax=Vibrio hyugaensis TaxID=1534743 RepID=A0ABQ5Y7C6_9VIBR|nr:hypothetical protein GCM10007906_31020 [Vibrio hyugaensis]